tara:strand:+ start:1768 stop:1884 length:117 start_codon:yes stop_codon:yes gene_type:complete
MEVDEGLGKSVEFLKLLILEKLMDPNGRNMLACNEPEV